MSSTGSEDSGVIGSVIKRISLVVASISSIRDSASGSAGDTGSRNCPNRQYGWSDNAGEIGSTISPSEFDSARLIRFEDTSVSLGIN